jgi:hypothetical protein
MVLGVSSRTTLALFAAAVAVVFGLGAALGAAVGPDAGGAEEAEAPPPEGEGVVSALAGYRLVPRSTDLAAGGGPFRFVVEGPDRAPVRRFTPLHERELHLLVVGRELTTYHHLHPDLGADGTWSVDVPPVPPGSYRAIADFEVADGPRLALGTDLHVAGTYRPAEPPPPSTSTAVDGYDVALATEPGDGGEVTATLTVRRDGRPVDLQPYLGAKGHLVALRAGDLAYAHVHPVDSDGDQTGVVRFDATLPAAGRYAFFFDFRHDDTVRTATFGFDQGAVAGGDEMDH